MGCIAKMKKIDTLLEKLHWNNSLEIQNKAIEELMQIKDLNYFLQPLKPYSKEIWDNCALILYSKVDTELFPYIDKLFEWLQDMNWPGALIIKKRLQIFSIQLLDSKYKEAIQLAENLDDKIWLKNLKNLYTEKIDDLLIEYLNLLGKSLPQ